MAIALMAWEEKFCLGLDEIDEQHKELGALFNQLHVAIQEHHGSATSREILDKLADYTRTHFAVEESLMRVSNYPDFAAHKQNHEDLIGQVKALQDKLAEQGATLQTQLDALRALPAGTPARDDAIAGALNDPAVGLALIVWGYGLARQQHVVLWVPPIGMRHAAALLPLCWAASAACCQASQALATRLGTRAMRASTSRSSTQ